MRYVEIFAEAIDELVDERLVNGHGVDTACDEVYTGDHSRNTLTSRRFQMKLSLMSRAHCADSLGLLLRLMMLSLS